MASELSKFIEDELLREGNTGERSQLLNGGTFNVEKPRQRQTRSNLLSKRNIACFVILIVVAGAVGTAIYHKDAAASKIQGWKKSNKGVIPKQHKPTPSKAPNKKGGQIPGGPAEAPIAAPAAASPAAAAQGATHGKLPATAKLPGKQPKRHKVPIAPGPGATAPAAQGPAAAPGKEPAPALRTSADPGGRKLLDNRIRSWK